MVYSTDTAESALTELEGALWRFNAYERRQIYMARTDLADGLRLDPLQWQDLQVLMESL